MTVYVSQLRASAHPKVLANYNLPDYSDAAQYPPSRKDDYLTQVPDLLNMTKFAAALLERGDFISGLPMQVSDCLSMGIEQDYNDKKDVNMKPLEWQVLLPTASTWLIIAGKVIYDHCLNNEVEDPGADAETQTGWGGGTWTVQRWGFWKAQLGAFAERKDMDDECRGFAARAVQRMTEVESGRQSRQPAPCSFCWCDCEQYERCVS